MERMHLNGWGIIPHGWVVSLNTEGNLIMVGLSFIHNPAFFNDNQPRKGLSTHSEAFILMHACAKHDRNNLLLTQVTLGCLYISSNKRLDVKGVNIVKVSSGQVINII